MWKRIGSSLLIILLSIAIPMKAQARETYLTEDIQMICEGMAEKYDVDKYLLMAFCEIESSGNPNVVSANGQYIGLMQLNKDTFGGDLTDPLNNIGQGANYLAMLRDLNDGDMLTAISIYSGEGGKVGFYSRKVLIRTMEFYFTYVLKQPIRSL